MQIDLSELTAANDTRKECKVPIEAAVFSFQKEEYPVEEGFVVLRMHHTSDRQVEIEADVRIVLGMVCSRCAAPLSEPFDLTVSCLLDLNKKTDDKPKEPEEEPEEDEDDAFVNCVMNDRFLDVDTLAFDALSENMPFAVYCKEDCKGLCPVCGKNLNEGDCGCSATADEPKDPRMARIADLFKNVKEV
ncbi:MAG: DUF177 domain-containing protein [Lachnospiraceae bacterium]|nr:DUF177 domain-containing protein [Lachnospiraceae bacterium]